MKTAANVDALTMLPVAVLRSPSPARCRPNTKTFHDVNLRLQASRFARDEPAAKFGVLGTKLSVKSNWSRARPPFRREFRYRRPVSSALWRTRESLSLDLLSLLEFPSRAL